MCRRENKDKTPRFIYAAWRFATTQGDECLLEARGISSVIMEHINWFCSDFHLCSPELLCSSKKQCSFMMALSWLEETKQWDDEKFYFLFCCQSDMHWQAGKRYLMPICYFRLDLVRRRMKMGQVLKSVCLMSRYSLSSIGLPTKALGKSSRTITCPNTQEPAS